MRPGWRNGRRPGLKIPCLFKACGFDSHPRHPSQLLAAQGKLNRGMVCFVYIVKCSDGMYYTGITWNLKKRIAEHNSGKDTSIQKSRLPVRLVYWEKFKTRMLAAKREKEIKGWRREKKELLIKSLR